MPVYVILQILGRSPLQKKRNVIDEGALAVSNHRIINETHIVFAVRRHLLLDGPRKVSLDLASRGKKVCSSRCIFLGTVGCEMALFLNLQNLPVLLATVGVEVIAEIMRMEALIAQDSAVAPGAFREFDKALGIPGK